MSYKFIQRQISNRCIPPTDFIETIGKTLASLPNEVFAPNEAKDIFGAIRKQLGPLDPKEKWTDIESRRWAMADALLVLAAFESSCKWDEGFDTSNPNESDSETKSAGAFQVSPNSRNHGADVKAIYDRITANVTVDSGGENVGGKLTSKKNEEFRWQMMHNHALAVEYIARDLRHTIQANGPVRDGHINRWLSRDAAAEWRQLFGKASPATPSEPPASTVPVQPPATEPIHNDWPKEADAAAFFGYPPNLTQIEPPYTMRMFYGGMWHPITKITCNVKVAASLRRIFAAIFDAFNREPSAIKAANADVYDGCLNDRNISGSSHRSMHAYAAAIDLDAEHNGFNTGHGKIDPRVVKAFKDEGWRWGGDYHGRTDPMHFEACV